MGRDRHTSLNYTFTYDVPARLATFIFRGKVFSFINLLYVYVTYNNRPTVQTVRHNNTFIYSKLCLLNPYVTKKIFV